MLNINHVAVDEAKICPMFNFKSHAQCLLLARTELAFIKIIMSVKVSELECVILVYMSPHILL